MMRKDVKVGFAIGGVVLAVLVVYVLVGSGNNDVRRTGAELVTEDNSNKTVMAEPPSAADHSAPDRADHPVDVNAASGAGAASNTGAPTATLDNARLAGDAQRDLTNPNRPDASADARGKANDNKAVETKQDIWAGALDEGRLLMSETPSPKSTENPGGSLKSEEAGVTGAGASTDRNPTAVPEMPPVARDPNADGSGSARDGTNSGGSVPGDAPRGNRATDGMPGANSSNIHIVQKNETLVKIAEMAYGNGNLWPAIKRANPDLDEKRMRPGTKIVMPAVNEVKPHTNATSPRPGEVADALNAKPAVATDSPPLDLKSQYRVQKNDSLYSIAAKLYGKGEMWEKIYDLNKATIGEDPAKLKLNMVLKLPEEPKETAVR